MTVPSSHNPNHQKCQYCGRHWGALRRWSVRRMMPRWKWWQSPPGMSFGIHATTLSSQSVSQSVCEFQCAYVLSRGWWFVVIIILRWVLWSPIKIVSIQRLSPSSFGMQTFCSTGIIRCMRLTIPMSGRWWLVRPNKVVPLMLMTSPVSRMMWWGWRYFNRALLSVMI